MGLADLQSFVVERLRNLDENQDLTPGSPADVLVIQPLLRRLGSDPFTVDLGTFLQERLNQEFPELATKEGDAITDLLIKTAIVLWDPVVRENQRIRNNLSFRDPTLLTIDEAEALGANLFAARNRGDFSRGRARIYLAMPQDLSVTPANYITSKGGLHFFPTEVQSIRVDEMLFNKEGELYYFDVNTIAEKAGDNYNIDPDELVTVANLTAAVRVTNKARFRDGTPDESAVEFVDRIEQELSERSLVTLRGIVAKLGKAFPELTRLGVVGTGDAQMNRDIVSGGSLGAILAGGYSAAAVADGENKLTTRRFHVDAVEADFTSLIGPIGAASGYSVTLHGAFPFGSVPVVRDLTVRAVVDAHTLDLNEQALDYEVAGAPWTLRKQELTLSGIPGGILFPDNSEGTVSIPSGEIHIGGATDVYVRGAGFDSASLVLSDIVDDSPVLLGSKLQATTTSTVTLNDLILGDNYEIGDATYEALANAATRGYALQILDAPNAGSYRILLPANQSGGSPVLTIKPTITSGGGDFRWRLLDVLDIDLVEPKETKITGSDMFSIQGVDYFDTAGGIDFAALGVGPNDIVRIFTGAVAGDYTVTQVLSPLFRRVQVDRPLAATVSGLKFAIFRQNSEGGLSLPLVRIDSIDLLDSSSQPVGSKIPYANPVDIQTRAFANVARGLKADITDALLGIVGVEIPSGAAVVGLTLNIQWGGTTPASFAVTFTGINPLSLLAIVNQINAACASATPFPRIAALVGQRLGLIPVAPGLAIVGGSARALLFGSVLTFAASDIRSGAVSNWGNLTPQIDGTFDVVQVLDGTQIGFYGSLAADSSQLHTGHDFFPEVGRHIQVGSRSIGSVRAYFLEPTSIEFGIDAIFTLVRSDGSVLRYFPDPTVDYQRIPALPSGVKPKDGTIVDGSHVLGSASTDFIAKGIQPGDLLVVDYQFITGSVALGDPVVNLSTTTLLLSINGGLDKTITFITDDPTIPSTDVTRQGVADQINRTVGQVICKITSADHLEFEADVSIIVRPNGTANTLLGFSTSLDKSNASPFTGQYHVTAVAVSQLTIAESFTGVPAGNATRQQFKVLRAGLQRICSTDMSKQIGTAGLYYFDVELISEGTGNQYNIDAGLQMASAGFVSDGYFLTTDDPNLTFSELERPRLHVSRSILEVGVSDDPDNATQLSGQNIQINYDRSTLTANVQSFASSETERVINESILARHLIPYFVRFDLSYLGGSKENVVTPDIETYISGRNPDDALEVGAIEKILSNRGASSITNPIDLIAVIHNTDRSISVERSQDRLNTGALAAFIPDVLNITRKLA